MIPARQSLTEFLSEFGCLGNEVAIAHRRGYRMERWSYRRVAEAARQFVRELEFRGVAKGDAVLLWTENSPEWIISFLGCVMRGAVVVPIDRVSSPQFASRVARQVQAKLVVRSRSVPGIDVGVPELIAESLNDTIARHSATPYPSPPLSRSDVLEIIFTSGTTAEPCGVVISHGNVLANIEPVEREIQKYRRYERIFHPLRFLNLLPLSHVFGQMLGMFIPPLLGGTVIFLDSLKPREVIDTIQRERVSVLVTVPRMIESLQGQIEREQQVSGRIEKFREAYLAAERIHFLKRWWRFRRVHSRLGWKFWAFISGGAALPEAAETFWNRLGYAVIQGYGLTETTSLVSLNHPFRSRKRSIGKPFPGLDMRVDTNGEILVRGESIATGYWRGNGLEPVIGHDGWFHTGDLASVGEDGRLYFTGRRKNIIVTPAGMNVHPEDLEAALRCEAGVRDSVVVGLERDGNAEPCAALLLESPSLDAVAIIERANQSLAEYQRIRQWVVWPEPDFPRTATQKPMLPQIRAAVAAHMAKTAKHAPTSASPLAEFIARVTHHAPARLLPDADFEKDLQLSSLDRVELMSVLEERFQLDLSETKFAEARTVGELERLLREPPTRPLVHRFPRWAQRWPITWIRLGVYYSLTWPATYLLAMPRIRGRENLRGLRGPVLVASNHVTYIDIGWILAALPARFRNGLATAMRGERLAMMIHPPEGLTLLERILEWVRYFLVIGLFNVFPLPKESEFLRSFTFVGDLVDCGWNILIFPEGQTTADGQLGRFSAGIGLLATRLNIPVVPLRLEGLYELKRDNRKMARPGQVRVMIGKPLRFSPTQDPEEVAKEIHRRVTELAGPAGASTERR